MRGEDFTAENITFQNDFYRTNKQEEMSAGRQEDRSAGAPALTLLGDRNIIRNVRVVGDEGTLYVGSKNCADSTGAACEPARSYFNRCFVSGNAGFIEGDGTAYFDDCDIHSTDRAGGGFITAQGKHYAAQSSVFVFRNCRFTADPGVSNVVLGKPWRDFSSVVLLNPQLGAHIAPAGWREWQPGATHRLETAFFRVFKPSGAGAATASLQLSPEEVARYSPHDVLSGKDKWNPAGGK